MITQNEFFDACRYGKENIVRAYIKSGQNINIRDNVGWGGLHMIMWSPNADISYNNIINITKMIIEAGGDPNIKTDSLMTPLMIIIKSENGYFLKKSIIKILIKNGADINLINSNGLNALMFLPHIYDKSYIKILKIFIDSGVNLNHQTKSGITLLMFVCENSDTLSIKNIVKMLIEEGVDLNLKDVYNYTVLMRIYLNINNISIESVNIAKIIIDAIINLNEQDENGDTLLISICKAFNPRLIGIIKKDPLILHFRKNIIRYLIKSGTNLYIQNKYKKIASDYYPSINNYIKMNYFLFCVKKKYPNNYLQLSQTKSWNIFLEYIN